MVVIILVQVLASDCAGVVHADSAAVARARDIGACTSTNAARLLIRNRGVVVLGAD